MNDFGFAILLGSALAGAAVSTGDKVVLPRTLTEGSKWTYGMKGEFTLELTGSTVTVEAALEQAYKGSVTEGERAGTILHRLEWTKMDVTIDGQEMGDMDRLPPPMRFWLHSDGSIAALKVEGGGVEAEIARLVGTVLAVPFPQEGAAIGEEWKREKPEKPDGAIPGTATYKLVGTEESEGRKLAKVQVSLKGASNASGLEPLAVTGELWLDATTGILVRGNAKIQNFAIQSLMVSGSVRFETKDLPKPRVPDTTTTVQKEGAK